MKTLLVLFVFFFSIEANAQNLDDVRELSELNNQTEVDAYPYITDDGLRLYYTGYDGNTNNLFYSSRPDLATDFEPRQLVDSALFSGAFSFWFTEDELEVYYSRSSSLYHATRSSTTSMFGAEQEITLIGGITTFIGGPSLTPNGDELYFYYDNGLQKYEYTNDSTYTFVSELVPIAGYDGLTGQLSKDGLTLFWSMVVSGATGSSLFKLERAAIGDDFTNPTALNNLINNSALHNSQPSYASAANVFVWTRNYQDTWSDNNLFIAQSSSASLDDLSTGPKELVKIVDLTGRETTYEPGKVLIYIYSDGTTERIFKLED